MRSIFATAKGVCLLTSILSAILLLSSCSSEGEKTYIAGQSSGGLVSPQSMQEIETVSGASESNKKRFLLPFGQGSDQYREEIYGESLAGTDYIRIEGLVTDTSFRKVQEALSLGRGGESLSAEWESLHKQLSLIHI